MRHDLPNQQQHHLLQPSQANQQPIHPKQCQLPATPYPAQQLRLQTCQPAERAHQIHPWAPPLKHPIHHHLPSLKRQSHSTSSSCVTSCNGSSHGRSRCRKKQRYYNKSLSISFVINSLPLPHISMPNPKQQQLPTTPPTPHPYHLPTPLPRPATQKKFISHQMMRMTFLTSRHLEAIHQHPAQLNSKRQQHQQHTAQIQLMFQFYSQPLSRPNLQWRPITGERARLQPAAC
ncbi:hypothetical protein V6N13_081106 [Hibiscus sabdariffa]|uniref:Uncharacterized protein n=1 Tax=Hibiscus sabdariffa TaxID=183260 RepID=A0ABR2DBH5_9ROSI